MTKLRCGRCADMRALLQSDAAQKSLAERRELEAEIQRIRDVCGEAHQMAGVLGAPVKALDNLSAAASGEPLPHETFLPVEPMADRTGERTIELDISKLTRLKPHITIKADRAGEERDE